MRGDVDDGLLCPSRSVTPHGRRYPSPMAKACRRSLETRRKAPPTPTPSLQTMCGAVILIHAVDGGLNSAVLLDKEGIGVDGGKSGLIDVHVVWFSVGQAPWHLALILAPPILL